MSKNLLAQDESMRSIDQDGRMHVRTSAISKATVNPYRGSEIPSAGTLGLDPDKVYWLLRDPAELAKGAATFNNIPILNKHVPVHVTDPQKDHVVGSTGTDAEFDGTYLRNSLVIWDDLAIAGVVTKLQYELSSAYRYDADMTPGMFQGVAYDGIMRNIRGNHVALVEEGRAGPDVVVGDSKLLEVPKMSGKKLSANARAVKAALTGFLSSRLAMDAQIGDLTAIAGSVKSLKSDKEKTELVVKVAAATKGKLAQDANLDGLPALLIALAQDEADEKDDDDDKKPPVAKDADEDDEDGKKKKVAEDADKDDDDKIDKPAMDAAIKDAVTLAETNTVARMRAIHTAEKEVAPFIGAIDSSTAVDAESIYKLALDAAKIDLTGVPPAAFRAMVKMLPSANNEGIGAANKAETRIAQDSAVQSDFYNRFPKAKKGGA